MLNCKKDSTNEFLPRLEDQDGEVLYEHTGSIYFLEEKINSNKTQL